MESHSGAVGNYLRRRLHPLSRAELDDLVEETFVVVWRRIDSVPDGDGERPWVIGVARNVLHNAHRARRRRRRHEAQIQHRGVASSAEEEAIADITGRSAMAALSSSDREILMLHYWDCLELVDLATVLGISANAAGTRLSRAKSRFVHRVQSIEIRGTPDERPDKEHVEEESELQ